MYPERNPIASFGPYTVHRGKLSRGDSRSFWIEGPDVNGRLCPVASCWNEGDAVQRAKELASLPGTPRLCTDPRHAPDNPCMYDGCQACHDECEPPK